MSDNDASGVERIPLIEESVSIEKRVVETGRVQVRTFVDDEQLMLREALAREIVDVERVAIGREVDVAPQIREEGEFLIVPVMEERLVVEKRLFLVEELRLRRTTVMVPVEAEATRRVMRAEVERDGKITNTGGSDGESGSQG
ncbi:YsnF/AvaK domain-containing protein [Sphingobium yanoikuyae]|uniref:YsnF/AvaK domain-containing protein n=1 Tax=Sphingobium yanoikuyae TaxID=13690 RepID=UPI00289BEA5B|nr:YsnF/AvaK domain-containing protein [Sphingobium yanoikuyae]